jgi:hypothetical protein
VGVEKGKRFLRVLERISTMRLILAVLRFGIPVCQQKPEALGAELFKKRKLFSNMFCWKSIPVLKYIYKNNAFNISAFSLTRFLRIRLYGKVSGFRLFFALLSVLFSVLFFSSDCCLAHVCGGGIS